VAFLEANMKYVPFLALLLFTAACGGGSEPAPEGRNAPAAEPREDGKSGIRAKINAKKQELAQADGDLARIAAEREQLAGQPASESKTNRLVELARLESDAKLRKNAITEDIADLQAQLSGPTAAAKPAKAGDALDDILAGNESKEKEEAERRKQKADAEAAADKERIAKAEAARTAEMEERAKQKIEGGRLSAGADGPGYEERWADVITKIRAELQRFKRW
jgi:hypothetical protein